MEGAVNLAWIVLIFVSMGLGIVMLAALAYMGAQKTFDYVTKHPVSLAYAGFAVFTVFATVMAVS